MAKTADDIAAAKEKTKQLAKELDAVMDKKKQLEEEKRELAIEKEREILMGKQAKRRSRLSRKRS